MNNNCTKCGNPLQAGTTICPICGTNNINTKPATPEVAPAPATPAPVEAPAVAPAAPVAPAPEAEKNPAPVVTSAAPAAPATPAPVENPTVAPTAPVAADKDAKKATKEPKAPKEKKPINKKLLIIVGIVAAVIIIGAVVAMIIINNSSSTPEPVDNSSEKTQKTVSSVGSKVSVNNFEFLLPPNWNVDTTSGTTAIVNKEVSTIVQFSSVSGDVNDSLKEYIQGKLASQGYENLDVQNKKIGNKEAIVAKAVKAGSEIQYDFYYIANSNLVVGAAVVYTNSEARTQNNNTVERIMQSLSFSGTVNMISEISMYRSVITDYNESVGSVSETTPETPSGEEQPSTPETPTENPSTPETPSENVGGRF